VPSRRIVVDPPLHARNHRSMAGPAIELDAVILGGGIAGLWTLARLRAAGVHAVLLETRALGAGQTGWAQGIIHGGIKYALTGEAGRASRAISAMPAAWSAAFAGGTAGGVDLRAARRLSATQLLWTTPGLVSRLAGAAASRAIRSSVRRLGPQEAPPPFDRAPSGLNGIEVYQVDEEIYEPASVVAALAARHHGAIARVDEISSIAADADGVELRVLSGHAERLLRTRRLLLTAGAGNEALVAKLAGVTLSAPMQRRPLHMVYARGRLPQIFGHCVTASTLPRITITSHPGRAAGDEVVWAIGGAIAERGVSMDRAAIIEAARAEVQACLPWLEIDPGVRWSSGRIDRAEGLMPDGSRPDEPVIHEIGRVAVVWPTKLAFAPLVAERLAAWMQNDPRREHTSGEELGLTPCPIAAPPWDDAGWLWT